MVSTFTTAKVGQTRVVGALREKSFTLDVTDYENPGGVVLAPSDFGFSKIDVFQIQEGENAYKWLWDGSLTAPTLTVYDDAFVELVDTTDAGTVEILVRGW